MVTGLTPTARYFRRFLDKSGIRPVGRALDLGCNDGSLTTEFARTADKVIGVDVSVHPNWERLESERLQFTVGDAEHLDFADDSFDSVMAINMLHHTSSPERAISEMVRVCRRGGTVYIAEPNRYNPLGYVHLTLMGNHQHFPTVKFLQLASGLGSYRVRRFECHCYPFPGSLISVLERLEDVLDVSLPWSPFLFYNVVAARIGTDD